MACVCHWQWNKHQICGPCICDLSVLLSPWAIILWFPASVTPGGKFSFKFFMLNGIRDCLVHRFVFWLYLISSCEKLIDHCKCVFLVSLSFCLCNSHVKHIRGV
ncbi:hypothetical protein [Crucivirus-475]|nr:hypothetical protein [Crucivirus-475]